jgi:hypothetical protein
MGSTPAASTNDDEDDADSNAVQEARKSLKNKFKRNQSSGNKDNKSLFDSPTTTTKD